jgi:hypothetical protein
MTAWLIVYRNSFQADILHGLAAELRAGGVGTVALPSCSKLCIRSSRARQGGVGGILPGQRGANWQRPARRLTAALLHVLSGVALFFIFASPFACALSLSRQI